MKSRFKTVPKFLYVNMLNIEVKLSSDMVCIKYVSITILLFVFSALPSLATDRIVVSKEKLLLYVITESADTVFVAPVACGINMGNKQREGDKKTPEGVFTICQIQNSAKWLHDFGDGKGMRKGAYGLYFFRLKVPGNTSIGIHGTCFPETVGERASDGCVRLRNEDLMELKKYITIGMVVKILPDNLENLLM